MILEREYHQRWVISIGWLLGQIDKPAARTEQNEELILAMAILRQLNASMPSGIDLIELQRVTSCERVDIDALFFAMAATPNLPYEFVITQDRGYLNTVH